ncbi:Flagellar biosynthesis pathway, component FliR [Rubellimicrobium thermophilum DSM 16684]|uniref:Flagellar biosynthesis pathway, component FliR n=1 Tax=Rubellimicrobium thermophilum DSM 16684 TaxID=1123069 RepID=S9QS14_9RHOB|nr:Flagellar biosynthesis pathway, component FliR [Rubellimicrobium thermophilum DSM 16684]
MSVDLASALAPLLAPVQDMFWAGFVVFLRLGTMMALLPLFGEQAVPVRIRLALAFAFTLVVAPAVAASLPDPGGPGRFLALLLGEAAAGLALGLLLRLLVIALQTAGAIAGQATSLSQLFGAGPGGEPSPAMGHLLVMGGLALAAAMGLHIRLALWMVDGYALIPAGAVLDPGLMLEAGLGGGDPGFHPCRVAGRALRGGGPALQCRAGRHQPGDAAAHGDLCRGAGADLRGPCPDGDRPAGPARCLGRGA